MILKKNSLKNIMFFSLIFVLIIECGFMDNIINKEEFNILIFGDFGKSAKKSTTKKNVIASARKLHKIKGFDLGIELGDNVYEFGITDNTQYKLEEIFTKDFNASDFNFDFLIVLGNHDHYGDINAQIRYSKHDKRYLLPERYYDATYTLMPSNTIVSFIVSDSTPIMQDEYEKALGIIDQKQIKTLHNMFTSHANSTYAFLLAHHSPTKSMGPHVVRKNNLLYPLCKEYHPTAIFSGHDHSLQFFPKSDTQECHQAIIGSSAKINSYSNNADAKFYHYTSGGFATLNIKKSACTLEFYSEYGDSLSKFSLNPQFN